MSLSILLICLVAERFLLDKQNLRHAEWFSNYGNWYERQALPRWMREGIGGVIGILLPPLLAIALLQQLLSDTLFGIPGALFACLVLLYSFGPEDLDTQVSQFTAAKERGDEKKAAAIAHTLLQEEAPTQQAEYSVALAERVLEQANCRIFGIIFWFMILGPLGAALYRFTHRLPKLQTANNELDFFLTSSQIIAMLDWVPARISAFSYAVAGNFEEAMLGWKSFRENSCEEFSNSASGILICTGRGALGLSTPPDPAADTQYFLGLFT